MTKPIKVFVNRREVHGAWGGGNKWLIAFNKEAPTMDIELSNPSDADVILLAGLDQADGYPSAQELLTYFPQKKFLLRVNECDSRKSTVGVDDQIRRLISRGARPVFVSEWLKKELMQIKTAYDVIINGCDSKIFRPSKNKYSKSNHKINIVCHHWSANKRKGQDYYDFLSSFVTENPEFTFTFIGRIDLIWPKAKPSTLPDNFRHIDPLWDKALGDELGKYDLCVNASLCDPGPNSCIETITCGLPTYVHADGGGGREFAGDDHIFSSFEELSAILKDKKYEPNVFKAPDWKQCISQYVDLIKHL